MKKLNLKVSELMNPTVLTRQQLKNVMGGDEVITTILSTSCEAVCSNGNKVGYYDCKGECTYEDYVGVTCKT